MKVRIFIDKVTALKSGSDRYGYVVVDVPAPDLTERQRATLAEYDSYWVSGRDDRPDADFYIDDASPLKLAAYDAESIRHRIDALADANDAAREEIVARWLKAPLDDFRYYTGLKDRRPIVRGQIGSAYIPDDPRLDARCEEAKAYAAAKHAESLAIAAERERKDEERRTEAARKREQEDREKAERLEALRAWALSSGSPLLVARATEGLKWEALARQEYADRATEAILSACTLVEDDSAPQGFEDYLDNDEVEVEVEDRTTPDLREIEALREVRKACEETGTMAAASLVWVTYSRDHYEEETAKRAEVTLEFLTPDGRKMGRHLTIKY